MAKASKRGIRIPPQARREAPAPGKSTEIQLKQELAEALERQAATAEILKVIARSPSEVQPVLDAILRSAVGLCGAEIAAAFLYDGKLVHLGATHNWSEEAKVYFSGVFPTPPGPELLSGRTVLSRSIVKVADANIDPHYDPKAAATGHWRRMLGVPMLREGQPLGAIVVCWREPGETPQRQIDLLQTFADQAVLAIENVRLFNETREALERQTATADILKVISSSPTDVQPVFEAIATRAALLSQAKFSYVTMFDGELLHMRATYGVGSELHRAHYPLQPGPTSISTRVVRDGAPVQVEDVMLDTEYLHKDAATAEGFRSGFGVPMMRGGKVFGTIAVVRPEPGKVPEQIVAVLQTFADQAVIAIENVRLFNETKQALEQQTATSEILRIISSSPNELTPVFKAILVNATSLCEAAYGVLWIREGDAFRLAELHGALPAEQWRTGMTVRPSPDVPLARVVRSGKSVHIVDMRDDQGYRSGAPLPVAAVEVAGMRTLLLVPMLKDNEVIGEVAIYRTEVRAFTERQIALIENFANQAVIAIENVRLFNETRALNQERLARLKSFFSPQLAEALAGGEADELLKTHRREITVQFFDLRGFTAFSGKAEPEEVMDLLRGFHGVLGKRVLEQQGTIERFGGDSVMVFYNDPVPVERPAERAVQAALAVLEAFEPIAAQWRRRLGLEIGLGVGIAQGYATLGAIGFEGRRDYAAIGPVTNLAARLCAEAKGGQILADRKTVAALEGSFEFDPVGDLQLKGFSQPVPAFALRGA